MNPQKKILLVTLTLLLIGAIGASVNLGPNIILPRVLPAAALGCPSSTVNGPCLTVSLDVQSTTVTTGCTVPAATSGQAGACDTTITATASSITSFRVGGILNASLAGKTLTTAGCQGPPAGTLVGCGVFSWQFGIKYDPTVVTGQADPNAALCTSYPECPENTIWYGSQTATAGSTTTTGGQVNWAGFTSAQATHPQSFSENPAAHTAEVLIGFSLVAPSTGLPSGLVINARNTLASVAFELVGKGDPHFQIADVIFSDANAVPVPFITAAPLPSPGPTPPQSALKTDPLIKFVDANANGVWDVGESIVRDTNGNGLYDTGEPVLGYATPTTGAALVSDPKIKFVDSNGDGSWTGALFAEAVVYDKNTNGLFDDGELIASCTTASCGAPSSLVANDPPHASFTTTRTGTSYTFTSTSTDSDGAITNYSWDFGDGSPIVTGVAASASHDYVVSGRTPSKFTATLRVIDNSGATGTIRDSSGNAIVNGQPSHATASLLAERGPTAAFTFTPASPTAGSTVTFDGRTSTYPDEPVLFGTAPVGGTALANTDPFLGYVDNDANAVFDIGVDTVVHDNDVNGIFNAALDTIISGPTPVEGSAISEPAIGAGDPKITFVDANANTLWDPGEVVIYDQNGNLAYDGILTYSWNFGDPASGTSNTATGATATHIFNPAVTTTFTVALNVTDNIDGFNVVTHTVTVTVAAVKHGTTTNVVCSPSTVAINQATSCTATVSDTSATGATAPTGTVTFTPSGTCTLGTSTTNSASCSVSITPTAVGTITVSASYGGDTTHSTSASTTSASVTVTLRTVSVAINCIPATPGISIASTCTATVTDNSPGTISMPTGTVTWTHTNTGAFLSTTCPLSGTGATSSCTATYTAAATGNHLITGTYGGDTTHATNSNTFTISVALAATSTTVACLPTTIAVGQTTSCTATVTDTSATPTTPTGTVNFTPTATCTLAGTGSAATCTVTESSTPAPGTLFVTATYVGDANHAASGPSAAGSVTVTTRTTTTTVSCNPSTVAIGQPTTCTATITDTGTTGATTPTGTVTFTPSGTCTLSGTAAIATCSVTISFTTAGSPKVSATYSGDATHDISTNAIGVAVNLRGTTTTVGCTPSTVIIGQTSSCTATVADSSPGTSSTPTGTVSWTASLGSFGTTTSCTLSTSGSCSVTFSSTTSGSATITGSYSGDTTHATSFNTATVTVGSLHPTTTTVACSPSTIPFGISDEIATTCIATIVDASASPTTPTGSVTFTQTGIASGASFTGNPCTLVAGNPTPQTAQCSVNFSSTSIGTASITAIYTGDNGHSGSDNAATPAIVTVTIHPTQTFVSCLTPIVPGASTDCNAIVDDILPIFHQPDPRTPPTGTVSWTTSGSGSFTSLQCTLIVGQNNVQTSCTVTYTPAGTTLPFTDTITATYSGDSTHSAGTPATTTITVNKRSTSTTVTCTPNSITTTQTSSCTATINSDASPGTGITPTGTVTFSQTGISTGAAFTSSPCTLVPGTIPSSASCSVTFSSTSTGTASITGAFDGDSTHAGSISSLVFTLQVTAVTLNPTTTTVSCTPTTVLVGQATSCTATVTDTSSTPTTPTGALTFLPSAFTCTLQGTATVGVATCSFAVTPPTLGSFTVTPTYPGDSTHAPSNGSTSVTVNPRTTMTVLTCVDSSVVVSQSTMCTATVTDTGPAGSTITPTTTVTVNYIIDGIGFSPLQCTLSGTTGSPSASCTVTVTPGRPGQMQVYATYYGDNSHSQSTSNIVTIPITVHATTTTVSCQPAPVSTGSSTTCTATVTDSSGSGTLVTPTGLVDFYSDAGTTLGSFTGSPCQLVAGATTGTASCSASYTPTGTIARFDTITAIYRGDSFDDRSSNTFGLQVTVATNVPPTVSFTESATTAFRGQSIVLTITSVPGTGTINTVTVNWGDTTIDTLLGTATTDSHAYSGLGSFTVTVTVTDSNSLTASKTATKLIIDQLPTVTFTETMTTAPTGTPITLTLTAADPDGTVASITVNWGDNTPIDTVAGTATTDSHTYAKAGSYTVTVTATDNDGGKTTAPPATKTITDRAPTASFTFTPSNPTVGQTISFDGTASNDPDGTITTYAWNFGDTTTGTGATTTHAYTAGGSYTVTLTVTDDAGLTGTTSATVQVTQQVTNPGHAKLIQWRADAKFNPDNLRRNPTQVLRAYGLNNGTVTVNVYVQFSITNPDGTSNTIYTKVVSLTPGQSINGRIDNRFTASFTTLPGKTNVTATIFYSSASSKIGDASFTPDNASAKRFSFNALGVRTDDFNFQDDITSTGQSLDVSVQNAANIDLISRIDITIRQPGGATTNYVSDGLLLQSGQNGEIKFTVPLTGPDGTYCFTATVKYGIDTNHNGQLDNNEILGTSGRQHDCFSADTDDAPAGSIIAPPMTIAHVSTDDCDD